LPFIVVAARPGNSGWDRFRVHRGFGSKGHSRERVGKDLARRRSTVSSDHLRVELVEYHCSRGETGSPHDLCPWALSATDPAPPDGIAVGYDFSDPYRIKDPQSVLIGRCCYGGQNDSLPDILCYHRNSNCYLENCFPGTGLLSLGRISRTEFIRDPLRSTAMPHSGNRIWRNYLR